MRPRGCTLDRRDCSIQWGNESPDPSSLASSSTLLTPGIFSGCVAASRTPLFALAICLFDINK